MAQTAPRPGTPLQGPGAPATRTAPATPDVFGPRAHTIARWTLAVVLGLVYGYWAAAINRDAGPITGWNVLFGLVTAFVFAVLHLAVQTFAPRLRRELHSALWAAFAGCAFGFLYSQGGDSVVMSTMLSLVIAAAVLVATFYRYYTHEDATGHRLA
ncbi:hypothetical protein [Streptomyces heilongjiangensis]|uniref:Integral membrane protein n=1 Tax=Streptomyces heilongjiangensis TaxID=945052 RepID=A0ABW1BAR7_9ACTN|nr:hypothetical protein [Streptomyces heilongjiangensis]MDC2946181.1 hypothetical protein [Streptomyces heilongjiangensis]